MKFSELDEAGWPNLQPYLDTCLLPVSGLTGSEAPHEMADRAADAGAWLAPLEQAFRGRTVTLPALHYYDGGAEAAEKLNALCRSFRAAGFRHVVLVGGRPGLIGEDAGADLVLEPQAEGGVPDPDAVRQALVELWRNADKARMTADPAGRA
ncbi:DUF2487 family protein [Cohnella sp. CFH 77786]|uniref:DUF2487 family protein n=1 Tax=Cohnella sp. CFH 77786 TaxID=2662265 RepID=UPI001C60D8A0|nr:DUF2487 family protein [Cohnella sp. CFH 77786]MBW5446618.1 DUF2487 family protein [Cohnella sp. CFH 77786]